MENVMLYLQSGAGYFIGAMFFIISIGFYLDKRGGVFSSEDGVIMIGSAVFAIAILLFDSFSEISNDEYKYLERELASNSLETLDRRAIGFFEDGKIVKWEKETLYHVLSQYKKRYIKDPDKDNFAKHIDLTKEKRR